MIVLWTLNSRSLQVMVKSEYWPVEKRLNSADRLRPAMTIVNRLRVCPIGVVTTEEADLPKIESGRVAFPSQ